MDKGFLIAEEEEGPSDNSREGHLSRTRDSHMQSDPHSSLHNREQLANEQRSGTFVSKIKIE